MSVAEKVRVLLVDDDEDDYLLTRNLVEEIDSGRYELDWIPTYQDGLKAIRKGAYEVCLLDYRLGGAETGLDFVKAAASGGNTVPIVVLSGHSSGALERELLAAGATDYLVKGRIDIERMWRALRHAIERNHALEALRERERLFRAVFDAAQDAMLIYDDERRYVDANPAALELVGLKLDEIVTRRFGDLSPPSSRARAEASWAEFLRDGHQMGESEIVTANGEVRTLEFRSAARILPSRHLSVLRDITERRRAESTRLRLAAIVEAAEDAIVGKELSGIILEWNPGAERIYGCSAAEAVGQTITRFVPGDRMVEWHEVHRRVRLGEHVRNLETVRRRNDGRLIDVSLTLSPLRDGSGNVVGACTITRDTTETNKLRARLAISDRMASVGTLAAGVAHEINNPLTAVIANLDYTAQTLAEQGFEATDTGREMLDALKDASDAALRVQSIVRDLKLFSRPGEEKKGAVDLRRAIDSTLRMVAPEIRHRARLVKMYGSVPTVDANESQLGQVFLNLLVNAAQAIPEGNVEGNEIRVVTRAEQGRVIVEIRDTGCGISPEASARIFDPFYTTKQIGVGTGLGLPICQGIVHAMGGEISVESTPGEGSTFRVTLPAGCLVASERPVTKPVVESGPRARILVIDDEPAIRRAIEATLQKYHDVTTVADARDALALLQRDERFDVILCDVMMPQVTGIDFYVDVCRVAPAVARRIVFMTGGAFTLRARAFLEDIPNEQISKPFEPGALVATVRELVRRETTGAAAAAAASDAPTES
jgi:PAS domain S-box-containing protein